MSRQIQWCIGFIDLNFVLCNMYTEETKMCITFLCGTCTLEEYENDCYFRSAGHILYLSLKRCLSVPVAAKP